MRGRKFYLDRRNGKLMGVCSGLSNHTGIDATWIRVGLVLVTLLGAFPWLPIAYLVLALVGKHRPAAARDEYGIPAPRTARTVRSSTADLRASMRDIDRRLLEVDSFVSSSNARLAQDIEQLR